jgi:hypothetical protein
MRSASLRGSLRSQVQSALEGSSTGNCDADRFFEILDAMGLAVVPESELLRRGEWPASRQGDQP